MKTSPYLNLNIMEENDDADIGKVAENFEKIDENARQKDETMNNLGNTLREELAALREAVYSKEESDTLLATGIGAHNASEDAHPALLAFLSSLENRLDTLELKYGTGITGNSFSVTFANLTGVTVTGVWNKTNARIEF